MAAVVLDGYIYVIGGRNRDGRLLSSVLRYDPASDIWHTDVAAVPEPREEAAAVVLDGKIYVIGGAIDDERPTGTVIAYDSEKDEWTEAGTLQHPRFGHRAAVVADQIWVVGGRGEDKQLVGEIESYSPSEAAWSVSSAWELKNPRVSFALVALADALYALFGYGSSGPLPDVERFQPLTEADEFVLSFLLRGRLATASVGNTAYLIGGRAERDEVINEVLMFTPSEDETFERWRLGPSMLSSRESFAAVSLESEIYAIGGRTQDGIRDGVTLSSVEVLSTSTGAESIPDSESLPSTLEQNHPNPFTNSTTIPFVLSGEHVERVAVEVYDLQGRLVDTVVDAHLPPGRHTITWSGTSADMLTSGVYFYVLRHGQNHQTRTMTRIR